MTEHDSNHASYSGPAGGWGSVGEIARTIGQEENPLSASLVLMKQNKPDGFACVSCAWAKPAKPHIFEFCENGAKATVWELTNRRATPEFFAAHTVASLEDWSDHDLEELGRLTEPMRWDAASDKYLPVAWDDAFAEIARELQGMDPAQAVFYTSGRACNEASYMYQLLARMYGSNNMPDSSNMCHESTSVALPESIGSPVGTVTLEDFKATDCILFFGQNVGTQSPRMLHDLQEARQQRDIPIITFNPLREAGLETFANPQSPTQMLTPASTTISTQYHQVMPGGDMAALMGLCKALIEADDAARASGGARVLDAEFIEEHTHGFEAFAGNVRAYQWDDLERHAGLTRAAIEAAANVYARAEAVIGIYGMGITQHRTGVENVQMLVNLLLLRGNIGKRGAGICPVRGHSNVQGQRTVGITEKPPAEWLDRLASLFYFSPPRENGLATVDACEQIIAGKVRGFIGLGGNFLRAVPERIAMEKAWRKLRLTVQIATKFNRNHVVHGAVAFVLPARGRIEIDRQATGPQTVTMEDSTACIHASRGLREPASPHLRSEPAIIAGIAKALLPRNVNAPWDDWAGDYALVRDLIAKTDPNTFFDYNTRMWQPGGFHRDIAACRREWKTLTGRANFIIPKGLAEDIGKSPVSPDILRLFTLRADGQFNTTIYNTNDRLRGITDDRMALLMNQADITRLGFAPGERVRLVTEADDDIHREVNGFRVVIYNLPAGSCAAYYPECNALIPLWHHAERAKVPAAKSIPVRIEPMTLTDRMMEGRAIPRNAGNTDPAPPRWQADLPAGAQVASWIAADVVRRQPLRSVAAGLLTGVTLIWAARRRGR
jgi:molybdopterin-dependent oxidoreductase alpha subunit